MIPTGNLLVIHTPRGFAAALADAIDEARLPEVAGTIAGDNTIFVAVRDGSSAAELADDFTPLPRGRRRERERRGGMILGSLPVGERVGIAFSGGLDTCCALAWMREKGAIPYAFTADLGQYDEPDIGAVPDRARAVRRRGGGARRLPRRARARGPRSRSSAAPSTSRPPAAATSTRPRSAAPSPGRCSCSAMREHGVEIWGDGSTYKGNDIERFYRYGLLANPEPADLQAVARQRLRRRSSAAARR